MSRRPQAVSRETLELTLRDASDALSCALTAQQVGQLVEYVLLLQKWNQVYNLTAVRDPLDMMRLHIIDSLAVQAPIAESFQAIPPSAPACRLMDLGAGAGLPGLVLAILNPEWQITLVDAVQKKVAFMQQVAAQLKLSNAQPVHGRIEQLTLPAFDAVVSRAFSDLGLFVQLALPHLLPSGRLFAMQGKPDDRLVAPFTRKTLHRLSVPTIDAARHLLILDHPSLN